MITFSNKVNKLTTDRKTPDQYDFLKFNSYGVKYFTYDELNLKLDPEEHINNIKQKTNVGWEYNIFLFQRLVLTKKIETDCFIACLIDPLEYAESVVSKLWEGYIGKVAHNAAPLFDAIFIETLKGPKHGFFSRSRMEQNSF